MSDETLEDAPDPVAPTMSDTPPADDDAVEAAPAAPEAGETVAVIENASDDDANAAGAGADVDATGDAHAGGGDKAQAALEGDHDADKRVVDEAGADTPPADTPSPADALATAPERADLRRTERGARLSSRLAGWMIAAALVPTALATLAIANAERNRVPPAPPVDVRVVDTTSATQTLDTLARELAAYKERDFDDAKARVADGVKNDVGALQRRIAEARDARIAAGATGAALSVPFSAAELKPVLSTLGVVEGRGRFVTKRDGSVVAPVGQNGNPVATGVTVPLATETDDAAPLLEVVDDENRRTVVARACVAKEKHCLVEVATFAIAAPDVDAARAVVQDARRELLRVDRAVRDAPVSTAALPDESAALLAAALLFALFFAGVGWRRVQRDVRRPLSLLDARLSAVAAGHAAARVDAPRPAEFDSLESTIDGIARTLADVDAMRTAHTERDRHLDAMAADIAALSDGDLSARVREDGSTAEQALGRALNRVLETLEHQVVRVRSHASLLRGDAEPVDGQDPHVELRARLEAIRPVPGLLADIAARIRVQARNAQPGSALQTDLAKLGEAVAQRAKTAQGLFDALDQELTAVTEHMTQTSSSGLEGSRARALEALLADLEKLGVDRGLATLLPALGGLSSDDVSARVAALRGEA